MKHSFLKEKYDLHKSPEVERAVKRAEQRTGEKAPQNPDARIQNYLDRLERLVLDPEKKQKREMLGDKPRPHVLVKHLREIIMRKYVRPHKEKMAEGAARVEERAAREMGIEARYGAEELEQRGDIAVEDLEKSLDQWLSYLSDANEPYHTWFRYYVFRNVLDLGDYDKDKEEFTKRSQGSTRLFPEIDRGALGYVQERIEAAQDASKLEQLRGAQETLGIPESELLTKEKAANFAKLSFAKQYAEGIKQRGEITPEMREETRGRWVKYQKGTDPTALWASLQNKGVAWCTKGFATAEAQLKGGDFYVYYTHNKQGKPAIPRIAIRMQGDTIGEVRGAADNDQNLEGAVAEIAATKMKELPGAERYKKASTDMKQLTRIENKTTKRETFTKDELVFLYEINAPIEGFGYQRDPRIAELRSARSGVDDIRTMYGYDLAAVNPGKEAMGFMYGITGSVPESLEDKIRELRNKRNPKEDMLIIFECAEDQIARALSEIRKGTKAYVGPLAPGVFDAIQEYTIEHVYTSFPESRIRIERDFEAGPITFQKFERRCEEYNRNVTDESLKIKMSNYAKDMLKKIGTRERPAMRSGENLLLVRLKVRDLGIDKQYPTTDDIYKRIEKLGLELCPAEVGPLYRLRYTDQPTGEWIRVGMKQITVRDGYPGVLYLGRDGDGLWLDDYWATPGDGWDPGDGFVFRLRKLRNLKT